MQHSTSETFHFDETQFAQLMAGETVYLGRCELSAAHFEQGANIHLRASGPFCDALRFLPGVERTCDVAFCYDTGCSHAKWLAIPLCGRKGRGLSPMSTDAVDTLLGTMPYGSGRIEIRRRPDGDLASMLCSGCVREAAILGLHDLCEHGMVPDLCSDCLRTKRAARHAAGELARHTAAQIRSAFELDAGKRLTSRTARTHPGRAQGAAILAASLEQGANLEDLAGAIPAAWSLLNELLHYDRMLRSGSATTQTTIDVDVAPRPTTTAPTQNSERRATLGLTGTEDVDDLARVAGVQIRHVLGLAPDSRTRLQDVFANPQFTPAHELADEAVQRGVPPLMLARALKAHRSVVTMLTEPPEWRRSKRV